MAYLIVVVSRIVVVACWKGMEVTLGRTSCVHTEETPSRDRVGEVRGGLLRLT
jgi:hypothetical protein